jgi:hypothetical protein
VIISPISVPLEEIHLAIVGNNGCVYVTGNSGPLIRDEAWVTTCYAIWNQLPKVFSCVKTKIE